ncbi:diacylglycerol kinase [Cohnella kolymensis]|uniref:Diacylglycerol kinase n=1 Tax=Cohnella kolymensis TaxID=1590652 RepID=A0ABR4ZZF6_9BACL|nr:diacylglycerol kinase family protein [Cohnella kolymensis]KIL34199.1 diacylglycerol kinase [Cohnella kolymensis]
MQKAAIILNPAAGNAQLPENIDRIAHKLRDQYDDVTIYETKEAGDGAGFVKKIASEVQLIVGAGGDGTIHELINALAPLENRPLFAVVPGGTCNDFSRAIGMAQDPLAAAEQIMSHRIRQVDIGKYGDKYFLNFWGIGLIAQVSTNIDSNLKDKLGKLSYYLSAAQTIPGFEPFLLKVESERFEYNGKACLLIVSNGAYTGGVKTFFPKTDLQDGLFDVLIIKETSIELAWQAIQSKMTSDIPESDNISYFRADKLTVLATPDQRIDCDGEISGRTPVYLENMRQHLSVILGDFQDD